MEYLDELIALYTGRNALAKKYFVSTAGGIPLGMDAPDLVGFLWTGANDATPSIRHQARVELGHLLPRFSRYEYGLLSRGVGPWSAYARPGHKRAAADGTTPAPIPYPAAMAAATEILSPFADRSLELLEAGGPQVRWKASVTLGQLRSRRMVESLQKPMAGDRATFGLAAALADLGGPQARQILLDTARSQGMSQPDLFLLLADAPSDRRLALIAELEGSLDAYGRGHLARLLAGIESSDSLTIARRLIDRHEGWVTAYTLDAISASPRAEHLELVQHVFEAEPHEFLRVLAVKVAGFIPSGGAQDFLAGCCDDPAPRVKASALEGLTRQRAAPEVLARHAKTLLTSPLLKAKVVATVVLTLLGDDAATSAVHDLLLSRNPLDRLEAAFILRYAQGQRPTGLLIRLAQSDPSLAVRLQATRSLSRQPVELALWPLLALIHKPDLPVAQMAVRAVSVLPPQLQRQLLDGLTCAYRAVSHLGLRAALLRTVGLVSSRDPGTSPHDLLLEALAEPEPSLTLGALEGLRFLGDGAAGAPLGPLLHHSDPRLRARAGLAALLGGDAAGLDVVRALVDSPGERDVLVALETILEAALAMPVLLSTSRATRLASMLTSRSSGPAHGDLQTAGSGDDPAAEEVTRPFGILARPLFDKVGPPGDGVASGAPRDMVDAGVQRALQHLYSEGTARGNDRRHLPTKGVLEASYLVELPPTWAEWFKQWGQGETRWFVIPVVLACLLGLTVWHSSGASTAAEASARNSAIAFRNDPMCFRVTSVEGQAQREAPGKPPLPLREGQAVRPGDKLSTGVHSSLSLFNGEGDVVWLGESSGVQIGSPGPEATNGAGAHPVLVEPAGDVLLDFRQLRTMEIHLGASRLVGHGLAVRVASTAQERRITVTAGEASLKAQGTPSTAFHTGEEFTVASPK